MNLKDWLVVVPARLASTRLEEKLLQDLGGKPIIIRVYERVSALKKKGAEIVIATDAQKILAACKRENVPAILTSEAHKSGTDRVHEVTKHFNKKWILNVQGDEPFVDLSALEKLMTIMSSDQTHQMGTLICKNTNEADYCDRNIVKVAWEQNKALYFSRSPIPCYRDDKFAGFWQHIGVYAFHQNTLDRFCSAGPGQLENIEKLEQLRALALGIDILTVLVDQVSVGIDTYQDLEDARAIFEAGRNS